MGEFANGLVNKLIAILLSIFLIVINLFFVAKQMQDTNLAAGWIVLIGKNYKNV